jgi:carnitine-CoA ligase
VRTYQGFAPTFDDRSSWTLPWILRERASTHGDRVILDLPWQGCQYTMSETLATCERIASGFLGAGLAQGDRLVVMAANCAEYILAWFASALAGLVEVPMNTAYKGSFLEHQIRTASPRALVVDSDLVSRFLDGHDAYATIEMVFVLGDDAAASEAVEAVRMTGRRAELFASLLTCEPGPLPAVSPRDLAAIFFTSGTTGLSKGVMMSHSQLAFFSDQGRALTRLTQDDVYMSVGPLFHGNAQFLAVYPALIAGARAVVQERFSATRWLAQIRESGVTVTNLIGVMLDFIWKQPPTAADAENSLRCIYCVPTAASIASGFAERFGVEAFVESFGSTEASLPIMTPYAEARPAGAAGLLLPEWFEVRIVDPETDEELGPNETGELVSRTKVPWTMCSGYYDAPDKTADALRNLWFHTGDAVRRDDEGWFYFVDRLKDAIRRRGENISSFELEQAVLGHPLIVDCAAVAIPAESDGGEDEVAIFVVPAVEAELGLDAVRAWCEERIPAFAQPAVITLLDELPYTPSGKVRKIDLRETLLRQRGSEE